MNVMCDVQGRHTDMYSAVSDVWQQHTLYCGHIGTGTLLHQYKQL